MNTTRQETADVQAILYTDGGASPNPGPGGWGVVVLGPAGEPVEELSGGEPDTTNNRMELTAAIRGLESRPPGSSLEIHTDSNYVRSGITRWIHGWIRNGWRRGPKKDQPVLNADLWKELHRLASERNVRWHWVKGHAGHEHNERADRLATAAIAEQGGAEAAGGGSSEAAVDAADVQALLKVRARRPSATWLALLVSEEEQRQLDGRERDCSASRAELVAGLAALRATPRDATLGIRCGDYFAKGCSQWLAGWKARGWKTAGGDPVKNADLWKIVHREIIGRRLAFGPLPKKGPLASELRRRLAELSP